MDPEDSEKEVNMLALIIAVGIAFFLQGILSFLQMRQFSDEFIKLRRKGKVACGRKSGGFHAGAIVMFCIDNDGIIKEGKKLEGITAFARVKSLDGFEGRYIGSLTAEDGPKSHKNLCKAIEDAALTYRKYTNGEVIEEPPTPMQKAGTALSGLFVKKAKAL